MRTLFGTPIPNSPEGVEPPILYPDVNYRQILNNIVQIYFSFSLEERVNMDKFHNIRKEYCKMFNVSQVLFDEFMYGVFIECISHKLPEGRKKYSATADDSFIYRTLPQDVIINAIVYPEHAEAYVDAAFKHDWKHIMQISLYKNTSWTVHIARNLKNSTVEKLALYGSYSHPLPSGLVLVRPPCKIAQYINISGDDMILIKEGELEQIINVAKSGAKFNSMRYDTLCERFGVPTILETFNIVDGKIVVRDGEPLNWDAITDAHMHPSVKMYIIRDLLLEVIKVDTVAAEKLIGYLGNVKNCPNCEDNEFVDDDHDYF